MGETGIVLPEALRRAEHLAQRRVGEETVVLDLRSRRVYGFNGEAGELLEALKAGSATAALCARAAGREAALRAFLAELVELGLVVAGEPAPAGAADAAGTERAWVDPRLLWREDVARVTHQISPPQAITNPQCQP